MVWPPLYTGSGSDAMLAVVVSGMGPAHPTPGVYAASCRLASAPSQKTSMSPLPGDTGCGAEPRGPMPRS